MVDSDSEAYEKASENLPTYRKEIRAFSDSYATAILNAYLDAGYSPGGKYVGTGIGVVSIPPESYGTNQIARNVSDTNTSTRGTAETSCDAIFKVLSEGVPEVEEDYYLEFPLGYVWYVEK